MFRQLLAFLLLYASSVDYVAGALNCTSIPSDAKAANVYSSCNKAGDKFLQPEFNAVVNVELGSLKNNELKKLLKNKGTIQIGISITNSKTIEEVLMNEVNLVIGLQPAFHLKFVNNTKLKRISMKNSKNIGGLPGVAVTDQEFIIKDNPLLEDVTFGRSTKIDLKIIVRNNRRLKNPVLDFLKKQPGAKFVGSYVQREGECTFPSSVKNMTDLVGCQIIVGSLTFDPNVVEKPWGTEKKIRLEGCLIANSTKLTTLDFLESVNCPSGQKNEITNNELLCDRTLPGGLTATWLTNCLEVCEDAQEVVEKACKNLNFVYVHGGEDELLKKVVQRVETVVGLHLRDANVVTSYHFDNLKTIDAASKKRGPSGEMPGIVIRNHQNLVNITFGQTVNVIGKGAAIELVSCDAFSYTEEYFNYTAAIGLSVERWKCPTKCIAPPTSNLNQTASAVEKPSPNLTVLIAVGAFAGTAAVVGGCFGLFIWHKKKKKYQKRREKMLEDREKERLLQQESVNRSRQSGTSENIAGDLKQLAAEGKADAKSEEVAKKVKKAVSEVEKNGAGVPAATAVAVPPSVTSSSAESATEEGKGNAAAAATSTPLPVEAKKSEKLVENSTDDLRAERDTTPGPTSNEDFHNDNKSPVDNAPTADVAGEPQPQIKSKTSSLEREKKN